MTSEKNTRRSKNFTLGSDDAFGTRKNITSTVSLSFFYYRLLSVPAFAKPKKDGGERLSPSVGATWRKQFSRVLFFHLVPRNERAKSMECQRRRGPSLVILRGVVAVATAVTKETKGFEVPGNGAEELAGKKGRPNKGALFHAQCIPPQTRSLRYLSLRGASSATTVRIHANPQPSFFHGTLRDAPYSWGARFFGLECPVGCCLGDLRTPARESSENFF